MCQHMLTHVQACVKHPSLLGCLMLLRLSSISQSQSAEEIVLRWQNFSPDLKPSACESGPKNQNLPCVALKEAH